MLFYLCSPMGEYLIDLAESALEPTGGGGGVISISTEDFDLVMRNAQDTLSLEEEINFYEEAISTKMRESISDNRKAAISRSGRKPLYSALAEGVLEDMVTDNKAILGCFPSRSSEVALAMKDRMLVLSCCEELYEGGGEEEGDDPDMVLDGSSGGSTAGSGSVWDSRAVEELAQLYQATPVIQLPYATDMDDDLEDDDDEDDSIGVAGSQESSSADDDTGWAKEDKYRHKKLAQAIADWLHMLTAFNYL